MGAIREQRCSLMFVEKAIIIYIIDIAMADFLVLDTIGSSEALANFSRTTNTTFFSTMSVTGGVQYDLTPGTYSISDFSSYTNADPPITGGSATIGGQPTGVPEPATYALLAFPLVALGLLRRRRAA